jgi:hypothetical protein
LRLHGQLIFSNGLSRFHFRDRSRFAKGSFFTGKRSFYLITLVESKAFLDVFRSRKMGKAFLSVKRCFSSPIFTAPQFGWSAIYSLSHDELDHPERPKWRKREGGAWSAIRGRSLPLKRSLDGRIDHGATEITEREFARFFSSNSSLGNSRNRSTQMHIVVSECRFLDSLPFSFSVSSVSPW